ncbi:MAG: type II secretion system F family protein [Rhodospirillales bacterium]|nr:type II secretion system F family protein [Rhodospirillales bacterium]
MSGALPALAGMVLLSGCSGFSVAHVRSRNAVRRRLDERLKAIKPVPALTRRTPREVTLPFTLPHGLRLLFDQADLLPSLFMLALPLAMGGVAAGLAFWWSGMLAAFVVLALPSVLAVLGLRFLARRRIGALIDGLPFFLETVRQALLIGNSLQQALTRATDNASPAMQRYLSPMARRIQNGAAVGDSLVWLAERLGVLELHMVATAVQANLRYGGKLSVVLANIVQVLRDGGRVRRELRAATAETRMSAMVLSSLPFAAFAFIACANAPYREFFFYAAQGHKLLAIAACFQLVGSLWMRRLMKLDF